MMSRFSILVGVLAIGLAAGPAGAQNFKGKGPVATKKFPLAEGLVIFEVQHRGEGAFVVKLVDEQGTVIDEVARGDGTFGGSKAIRVPQTGAYLFDVQAPGEWSVRLTSTEVADEGGESTRNGREEGRADGGRTGTGGWLARGFAGGLLGGPIGIGLVISRVDGATERDFEAAAAGRPMGDLAYAAAYREAFTSRLRTRRQRNAVIGGAVGTSVLAFALIQLIDLGRSSENDNLGPGDPGVPFIVVPIRF
jgi:hypothetical protein